MATPLADDSLNSSGSLLTTREDWSYQDGFIDGWKLVSGQRAALPEAPAKPDLLAGLALYKAGLLHGIEAAKKRKGIA